MGTIAHRSTDVNVFEAIRRATDPLGVNGDNVSWLRPSAKEVLIRLGNLGFTVVPRELTRHTFTVDGPSESEQRLMDGNR